MIYVVEDQESAQFRYRVQNVMEALEKSERWCAKCFLKKDVGKIREALEEADLLVIERQTAKDNIVLALIHEAKERGITVLFDLDDLIFDYRDLPILMKSTNSKNVLYWVGYFWGIRRIAKKVDGFLCTNDYLGKKMLRSFGKPYGIIPNSLSREQLEVSDNCLPKKKHEKFIIGYFSGSPTHAKDFKLVESELISFLNEHKDAILRVVGYMKFSKKMQKLIDARRVKVMGLVNYLELQELIADVDVNIAPLTINDFTNCKSELKYFEAAVVETTTIASPTYAFEKAITDGKNGFLAKSGEWHDKLEFLYENSEENSKVSRKAREHALKHYYGKEFLKEVEAAFAHLYNDKKH